MGLLLAAAAAAVVVAARLSRSPVRPTSLARAPGAIVLLVDRDVVGSIPLRRVIKRNRLVRARVEAEIQRVLPRRHTVRRHRATITLKLSVPVAVRAVLALGPGGGRAVLPGRPVASRIEAPVTAQALRNNCESAALSILLATTGVNADQLDIQRRLPRNGPLDPRSGPQGRIWGDPELGFVGRADGGGTAGGFGVYPGPVARVAASYKRRLGSLTGSQPADIYKWLRSGRAVMAWVGLSAGPFGTWRSPAGRKIRVNFGEHTVVLNGIAGDGTLLVVNPLQGTRERWSRNRFESMWDRLGRRALGA